jgi:hypothetical protein
VRYVLCLVYFIKDVLMFKKFMLTAFVSTIALSSAQASDFFANNNNNETDAERSARMRVQNQAPVAQQAIEQHPSAGLQLNFNQESSERLFFLMKKMQQAVAQMQSAGGNSLVAKFTTNTPHVTMEVYHAPEGENLCAFDEMVLNKKLKECHQLLQADGHIGGSGVKIVPMVLTMIAVYGGDRPNEYYTAQNIHTLLNHAAGLREVIFALDCGVLKGSELIPGSVFLGHAQKSVLHTNIHQTCLRIKRFEQPLLHTTLLRVFETADADTFYNTGKVPAELPPITNTGGVVRLFHAVAGLLGQQKVLSSHLACDKIVYNPVIAYTKDDNDNGKKVKFGVQYKMNLRSKPNWSSDPRTSVQLGPNMCGDMTLWANDYAVKLMLVEEQANETQQDLDALDAHIANREDYYQRGLAAAKFKQQQGYEHNLEHLRGKIRELKAAGKPTKNFQDILDGKPAEQAERVQQTERDFAQRRDEALSEPRQRKVELTARLKQQLDFAQRIRWHLLAEPAAEAMPALEIQQPAVVALPHAPLESAAALYHNHEQRIDDLCAELESLRAKLAYQKGRLWESQRHDCEFGLAEDILNLEDAILEKEGVIQEVLGASVQSSVSVNEIQTAQEQLLNDFIKQADRMQRVLKLFESEGLIESVKAQARTNIAKIHEQIARLVN